ncbi:NAD(P)-binding protein [Mycena rosella]|uniref:NAD(P)-binding protein n=1 Tax=Mycena rosella TaxID=1033263 RepID=A0AAD7DGF6_MYCRO|nr:NAD(P)-binding protein [Mycena rosella]
MKITQNSSAPLVAVFNATGTQGGSVIKALEESDKPYRIRGFTRDATKPSAQELVTKGVEVVTISLLIENQKEVRKAFSGANMAFEVSEAKMFIDSTKAAGVQRVVWSGLTSFSKASPGKYVHVYQFDGKADIAEYGRQSGVPNFLQFHRSLMLTKQDDGTFAIEWPVKPTTTIPIIDIAHDYGPYVRQVLELPVFPDGSEMLTAGENISVENIALQLSEATGKKIVFKQLSITKFRNILQNLGLPAHMIPAMQEVFQTFDEFGYYGGKPTTNLDGLVRKPRTWAEFARIADWSKVLV